MTDLVPSESQGCRWPLACDYPSSPKCWPGGSCSGMDRNLDLGHDHRAVFLGWAPDRELNPQYEGIPDEPRYALLIHHKDPAGAECSGMVTFAGDVQRRVEPDRPNVWTVQSWDPLTISPSVLCSCGDHGFIRNGRWEPA